MKKVLYDGIISSLQSYGGVTVYFNELLKRMREDDFSVVEYDNSTLYPKSEVRKSRLLERYRDFENYTSQGEIFHSTYYRIPTKKDKISVITTVHDFTYEKYVSGLSKKVHLWQKYKAIKNSDKIICVSQNTANDLLKYCPVNENKIYVVHNGVSRNYFKIENTPVTNKVVFIGARKGYKNFDKAVLAVAMTKDLELVIVGGGELDKSELSLLTRNLPNRFTVTGKLKDNELNLLYNSAYCLIYPSDYEGFGIPILEAMRAGCPVIAVNRSSIPEVAGNSALLVDDVSPNILYEALEYIDSKRAELISAGLNQAEKFSWDRCFKETLSIYNKF